MNGARIGIFERDTASRQMLRKQLELGGHQVVGETYAPDLVADFLHHNPGSMDVAIVGCNSKTQHPVAVEIAELLQAEAPEVQVVAFGSDERALPGVSMFINRDYVMGDTIRQVISLLPGEGQAQLEPLSDPATDQ